MDLLKRFILFGFGLTFGIIFVFFVWDKKKIQFDYLPNARVIKKLSTDKHVFSKFANKNISNLGIDTTAVITVIKNGTVDFKKSSPRQKPCKLFYVDGTYKEKNITVIIKKCDTISIIDKVIIK